MTTLVLVPSPLECRHLLADNERLETNDPFPAWRAGSAIWAHCGIGPAASTLGAMHLIAHYKPARVVVTGIAGGFIESGLTNGDIMQAKSDCFADLGFQENGKWQNLDHMGFPVLALTNRNLGCRYDFEILDGKEPQGDFVTVSTITASRKRAVELRENFACDIENMEGASVAMVCHFYQIPCFQIRTISNPVGPRDRDKWEVEKPLKNLRSWLLQRL